MNSITGVCEKSPDPPLPCKDKPNMYLNPITETCEDTCAFPNVRMGDKCYPPCPEPDSYYYRNGETGECTCIYPLTKGKCEKIADCLFPSYVDTKTNICIPPIPPRPPCEGVLIKGVCYNLCKKENEHMDLEDGSCDCNVDYVRNIQSGECEVTCEKKGMVTAHDGSCHQRCDETETTDFAGNCHCPPQTKKNSKNGKCENCPEGQTFSSIKNDCIPTPCEDKGFITASNGDCVQRCFET